MGRTHVLPVLQQTEVSCGPASIKHALGVFGIRKSLTYLGALCETTRNGTSTNRMIRALTKMNFAVLAVENATLRHLSSALKYSPNGPRAVIVDYLYENDQKDINWKDSGHWATVSSFSASNGRLIIFDSYTGKKKSYIWKEFLKMWKDFDHKRKYLSKNSKKFTVVRKWQHRLMLIIAKDIQSLPSFTIQTKALYPAN